MIVSEIIKGAHKLLGLVTAGEDISSAEYEDGLEKFNDLMSHLNTMGLFLLNDIDKAFEPPTVLSPTDPNYDPNGTKTWKQRIVIGGGDDRDYNIAPPTYIKQVYFSYSNQARPIILTIVPIDHLNEVKLAVRGMPKFVSITRTEANGMALEFDYIPLDTYTLHIVGQWSSKIDETGAETNYSLTDDINLNLGAARMLKLQLALELADLYSVQISQQLYMKAEQALKRIKEYNAPYVVPTLKTELYPKYNSDRTLIPNE